MDAAAAVDIMVARGVSGNSIMQDRRNVVSTGVGAATVFKVQPASTAQSREKNVSGVYYRTNFSCHHIRQFGIKCCARRAKPRIAGLL